MNKLSVTIIAYNEEENIRDCLENVKWADEIVVVDAGSKDKTVEISREYTDKVYINPWPGHYQQKNFAIDKTANLWILSIDADERVTPELRKEVERVLTNPSFDGYLFPRKNYFLGKWMRYGGWYPDHVLRLFRKDKGRFEQREVHEAVKINGKAERLKNPLEHYTYRSLNEYIERMDRYSTLAAMEMAKRGKMGSLGDIIFRPFFTFIRMYILQLGFRDGIYGFILSALYAYYTFVKYAKLWEIKRVNSDDI